MSVTSVYPNVSPYVGNPATDMLRRENARREVIAPVAHTEQQPAGQGVVAEDKSRNQPQPLTYDLELKNRGTELRQAIEGRQQDQQGSQHNGSQQGQSEQQSSQQHNQQHASDQPSSGQQGFQQSSQQQAGSEGSPERRGATAQQLSVEELEQLEWLQQRDDEVRQHERAHASVGGQYAGAPSYDFKRGPDGGQYAVGGEVPIDVSPIADDPAATIQKMQQVRRAALAPAEPSGADRSIAAQAAMQEAVARQELAAQAIESQTTQGSDGTEDSAGSPTATASPSETNSLKGRDYRALNQDELMQLRTQVIHQFYQTSTVPADRPLRLTT